MNTRKHIVVGTGALGRNVAACLADQGILPTLVNRSGKSVGPWPTVSCDVSDPAALSALLIEPVTLYICSAPPYWRWKDDFPAMVEGIVQATAGRDVRIVLADNVYAYGRSETPFKEGQSARPCSRKGEVRRAVAERLMALNEKGQVRVTVVRAATFFGPWVEQSSVGRSVFETALNAKATYIIGDPKVAHAFTYVPDFAVALLRIAQEDSAFGHYWHAPSHNVASMHLFLEMVARQGRGELKIKRAGPLMMRFIGLFNPAMRELVEMQYLFDSPWGLSSALTERTFQLASTPLETAISRTAEWVREQPGSSAHSTRI